MDDQQTYLLNGLLTRHFGLGRIVRFRQVARGRQAQTFEILTQEQHEYLVHLYPAAFAEQDLTFAATTINMLDRQRFSVVPMLPVKTDGENSRGGPGGFVALGPQGAAMMVSLVTTGSPLLPEEYTDHDISQVGLRLAWLHRLLKEELPAPKHADSLATLLDNYLRNITGESLRRLPPIRPETRDNLLSLINLPTPQGWAHGDIHPAALLVDSDRQLRTLVDFGLLHFGSPHEDLIDALLSICTSSDLNFHPRRARCLLESYDSLSPIRTLAWTPVVAAWIARQILNASVSHRPFPKRFSQFIAAPEVLATAIASHIT